MNKKTRLYYVKNPVLGEVEATNLPDDYLIDLSPGDYFCLAPKFSKDFSRLAFIASR